MPRGAPGLPVGRAIKLWCDRDRLATCVLVHISRDGIQDSLVESDLAADNSAVAAHQEQRRYRLGIKQPGNAEVVINNDRKLYLHLLDQIASGILRILGDAYDAGRGFA